MRLSGYITKYTLDSSPVTLTPKDIMKAVSVLVLTLVAAASSASSCVPGQTLLLRHEDCNKFYACVNGVSFEMMCPPGLYFNIEKQYCDMKANVDCVNLNPIADTGKDKIVALSLLGDEDTILEEPKIDGVIEFPTPEVIPIPEGDNQGSDEEDDVSENDKESSEDEEIAPETGSESSEDDTEIYPETEQEPSEEVEEEMQFLENGCPVDPHVHWLLPHEKNCNEFYYCVWGKKELRQCNSVLHFNKVLQVCDWQWNAGCSLN